MMAHRKTITVTALHRVGEGLVAEGQRLHVISGPSRARSTRDLSAEQKLSAMSGVG
jgi:hypothetical protein